MSDFLAPALRYSGTTQITIPEGYEGTNRNMTGVLYMSKDGFVFSASYKFIIWLKFLGLAIGLPFVAIAVKCNQLCNPFLKTYPKKGMHDLKHSFRLANIAWKAVTGTGKNNLMKRMEEFALAELDYNHKDRIQALNMRRSERFSKGVYAAMCMQPFMHKSQYIPFSTTKQQIAQLDAKYALLNAEWHRQESGDSWSTFLHRTVLSSDRPYKDWSKDKIKAEMDKVQNEAAALRAQLRKAERCNRLALAVISDQQCCHDPVGALEDQFVTTDADVKCGGKRCYRQQRVCGIIYKIDCCATRCWAIDCLCCFCCIWPDGRQACVL